MDVGIDIAKPVTRGGYLRASDGGRAVEDLTLQVRKIDAVEIHQPDVADAGGCEIQRDGRAESARTDEQHSGLLERALAAFPDSGQEDVTTISDKLFASQLAFVASRLRIHVGVYSALSRRASVGR